MEHPPRTFSLYFFESFSSCSMAVSIDSNLRPYSSNSGSVDSVTHSHPTALGSVWAGHTLGHPNLGRHHVRCPAHKFSQSLHLASPCCAKNRCSMTQGPKCEACGTEWIGMMKKEVIDFSYKYTHHWSIHRQNTWLNIAKLPVQEPPWTFRQICWWRVIDVGRM